MLIIPDTNFMIYCVERNVNIEEELSRIFFGYRLLFVSPVISELKKLSRERKKENAKIALQLAKKFLKEKKAILLRMKIKNADAAIIRARKKFKNAIVATFDKQLKAKLKNTKFLNKKLRIV